MEKGDPARAPSPPLQTLAPLRHAGLPAIRTLCHIGMLADLTPAVLLCPVWRAAPCRSCLKLRLTRHDLVPPSPSAPDWNHLLLGAPPAAPAVTEPLPCLPGAGEEAHCLWSRPRPSPTPRNTSHTALACLLLTPCDSQPRACTCSLLARCLPACPPPGRAISFFCRLGCLLLAGLQSHPPAWLLISPCCAHAGAPGDAACADGHDNDGAGGSGSGSTHTDGTRRNTGRARRQHNATTPAARGSRATGRRGVTSPGARGPHGTGRRGAASPRARGPRRAAAAPGSRKGLGNKPKKDRLKFERRDVQDYLRHLTGELRLSLEVRLAAASWCMLVPLAPMPAMQGARCWRGMLHQLGSPPPAAASKRVPTLPPAVQRIRPLLAQRFGCGLYSRFHLSKVCK